jgi:uncharacterized membrane protein YgdD (TMEM256/DUF423 family)
MTITQRLFSGFGALCCLLSVIMAAYASHGLEGTAQYRMNLAAAFSFMHGLALIVLNVMRLEKRLLIWPSLLLLIGLCLFSGSLAMTALFGFRAMLAPAGGVCLMVAWVWLVVYFIRKE